MKAPTLARAMFLNFIDGGVSLSAALIVSVMLARTLGPDRFGLYALVMSIVMVTLVVARMGISSTVRRFVAEQHAYGDQRTAAIVVGRGIRLALQSGILGTVLLAVAAAPLAAFFHQNNLRGYLLLGGLMVLPMVLLGVLRSVAGGYQQYRYLLFLNVIASPLWIFACVAAILSGAGITGILIASLATDLGQLVAVGWWVVRNVGVSWQGALPDGVAARLMRYNATLAVLIVLNAVVWERSEILFLGWLSVASQVAFYAVPFALTEKVVDLIPGALLGVLLPRLTYVNSADPVRFGAVFSESLRYLAILTLPICLFGIPLAPALIRVLYGPRYAGAVLVLQILLVSIIFGVLGQASRSALLGIESNGWLLKTGVAAAAVSITLDIALIPRYGAIGAAIANTVVQGLWAFAIVAPLLKRIVVGTGEAILKAASIAVPLAAVLFVLSRFYPATLAAVGGGIAVLVLYGVALQRLDLLKLPERSQFS